MKKQARRAAERNTEVFRGGNGRFDYVLLRAIEDGLNESLGQSLALATRVCLDTTVALKDPITYVFVLETLLGNRTVSVIRRIEEKFQTIGALQPAGVANFYESIKYLSGSEYKAGSRLLPT